MNDNTDSSNNAKHVAFSLKLAGVLIGVCLLMTLGRSEGLISQGWVERAYGILLGLLMAAYGNAIPKFTGTPPTSIDEAHIAQSLRRVSGWTLTLGFLLSAGLWAFAPRDVAQIGSIVCGGLTGVVVFGFTIGKYIQCQNARARDISKSILA